MDKYTNTLLSFFRIIIGTFCILIGLAFISVSLWVSTFSDIASMILIIALLGGGALINFGVGYAFLKDEYKLNNYVREGNSTFSPVETTNFLIRRKIVTFTGFICYVLLSIYYIVRIFIGPFFIEDYEPSIAALIAFSVLSLVVSFCLLMVYLRTKNIDLNEEETN